MELSKYQLAIIDHIKNSDKNLVINALAGSGKTSTATICVNEYLKMHPYAKVCMEAFNKSIADELSVKVTDARCLCKTSHAMGYKAIMNAIRITYGKMPLVINNMRDHFKLLYNLEDYSSVISNDIKDNRLKFEFIGNCDKLLNLCRVNLIQADEVEKITNLAEYHGIDCKADEVAVVRKFLSTAYELHVEKNVKEVKGRFSKVHPQAVVIDYTDMVTFGALHPTYCPQYNFVVVDECQDLNRAQQLLFRNMIAKGGKFMCVGDPHQAINGFAGAMCDSFEQLVAMDNTDTLPLSVNYRCGKKIIERAQTLVPEIVAHEGAIEGNVEDVNDLRKVKGGDYILCRTKAPLVMVAMKFLRQGRCAIVLGSDIGKNLKSFATQCLGGTKFKGYDSNPNLLIDKARECLEHTKTELLEHGYKGDVDEHQSILDMTDKIECLDNISLDCQTIKEVFDKIDKIFSDENKKNAVICMTCHKSKGLESDNVFIVLPNKLPLTWDKQTEEQYQQELNLQYVAYTRAKENLYIVNGDYDALKSMEIE